MWTYIIEDLRSAAKNYLAIGLAIGLIVIIILAVIYKLQSEKINKSRLACIYLFAVYITAAFEIAFFSREPGQGIP